MLARARWAYEARQYEDAEAAIATVDGLLQLSPGNTAALKIRADALYLGGKTPTLGRL